MRPDPALHPLHLPPGFRHLWIFFVAVGILNLVILGWRFRKRSIERPDLAAGYRKCLAGYAVFLLLPWLVMGYGIEVGGVSNIFSFIHVAEGNSYILAFYVVITLMAALLCVWMCFFRGAEFLIAHPGTLDRNQPSSPAWLRAYAVLGLASVLIVLLLRFLHLLPEPPII